MYDKISSLPSSLQLADSAWPKFRHDVENTGQSQFPSYADGTLKWKIDPIGMIKLLRSSPAMTSPPGEIIYISDHDGVLRAFDTCRDDRLMRSSPILYKIL